MIKYFVHMYSANWRKFSKDYGFGCSAAQKDLACSEIREQGAEDKIFSGLLDGTGEYTLICEDSEGGRTIVRDLPWK
jgi:auxin-responsive protein IAA